jgi:hypothetical protein
MTSYRTNRQCMPATCVALWLASAQLAAAEERHVPDQYPSIQAAIDACNDGDVVVVADGTYTGVDNRRISFFDKAIIVRSANGPDNCIIDCLELECAFFLHSGEGPDSVVEGFTIVNGHR